jgi:hypothetical protein
MTHDAPLTSDERRTYQALRARGFSHEDAVGDALGDALDGVEVHEVRRVIPSAKEEACWCGHSCGHPWAHDYNPPRRLHKHKGDKMSDYEPGTIVRGDTPHGGDLRLMRTAFGNWWRASGELYDPAEVTNIRPQLVLDPDDAEQVVRLAKACPDEWLFRGDDGTADPAVVEDLQNALRTLLPKLPKPAEPTGLGTVVEERGGAYWVLIDPETGVWINYENGTAMYTNYADIDVVRVLP